MLKCRIQYFVIELCLFKIRTEISLGCCLCLGAYHLKPCSSLGVESLRNSEGVGGTQTCFLFQGCFKVSFDFEKMCSRTESEIELTRFHSLGDI